MFHFLVLELPFSKVYFFKIVSISYVKFSFLKNKLTIAILSFSF